VVVRFTGGITRRGGTLGPSAQRQRERAHARAIETVYLTLLTLGDCLLCLPTDIRSVKKTGTLLREASRSSTLSTSFTAFALNKRSSSFPSPLSSSHRPEGGVLKQQSISPVAAPGDLPLIKKN